MANVKLSRPFSFLAASDWNWDVTSYSASSITISDGTHKQMFSGSFSKSGSSVSGTVTATKYFLSGALVYEISAASLSASKLATFASTSGDTQATYAYVLATNDVMTGSSGADALLGYAGADTLIGGAGADVLREGTGNDVLRGGAGNDTLTGEAGADVFRFDTALASNVDKVTDFNAVTGHDKIQLENSIFTHLAGGALSAGNYVEGASADAQDSDDYVIYDTATGKLYYDAEAADGSGSGAKLLIATLWNGTTTHPSASQIAPADFLIT